MNMQTLGLKGTRTFLLGMLAGASIAAGGLVLARSHHQFASPAVIIQTNALEVAGSTSAATSAGAELPPTVELTRAVVIGHRLKILVRSEQDRSLSLAQSSSSYL